MTRLAINGMRHATTDGNCLKPCVMSRLSWILYEKAVRLAGISPDLPFDRPVLPDVRTVLKFFLPVN